MRRNTQAAQVASVVETPTSNAASTQPRELTQIQQAIRNARRVSTPLIAICTADQEATLTQICELVRQRSPVYSQDGIRGILGQNETAKSSVTNICPTEQQATSRLLPWTLMNIVKMEQDGILVIFNAHRYIDQPEVSQGIANLRDVFKANRRCLILLGPQFNNLPEELQQDVVVFQEALPDPTQLRGIVDRVYSAAAADMPDIAEADDTHRSRAVDATRGLSAFAAEQAIAMATTRLGISVPALWELKRAAIEKVPGIKFYRGRETYVDIGGLDALKAFFNALFNGPERPSCLVWMDEIEKSVHAGSAGMNGDTSGVSQDALKTLLSMEDEGWTGSIFLGPPGCAKSLIAKATGNSYEVPTLAVDLGACKGSLVGQSEARIRAVLKTIRAIAGANVFFIATCNKMEVLPPELKRRLPLGPWFVDLPTPAEKQAIWDIQMRAFNIRSDQDRPNDTNWSGADIRNCCRIAHMLQRSLLSAATMIIPVAVQDSTALDQLRQFANNRLLSANVEGPYTYVPESRGDTGVPQQLRRITGDDEEPARAA
jgi:hypothetical protein